MALQCVRSTPLARSARCSKHVPVLPFKAHSSRRCTGLVGPGAEARLIATQAAEGDAEALSATEPPEMVVLRRDAGWMKTLSTVAFWTQISLSVVSGGILLFSLFVVPGSSKDVSKYLTFTGVVFAFISSFFAHGFLNNAEKLIQGGVVAASWLSSNLLLNNTINLAGIFITVIGLQASVGTLVGKALMAASTGPITITSGANAVISLDVFSLQALSNTLLCHVLGLFFTNMMMRTTNNALKAAAA